MKLTLDKSHFITGGESLRIAFIIHQLQTWNSVQSIYNAAVSDSECEVIVLYVPNIDKQKRYVCLNEDEEQKEIGFFNKRNIEAIFAFDKIADRWYNLKNWKPDYVLYTRPYNSEYPELYTSNQVCKYSKVCYIPYGYPMLDTAIRHSYNATFLLTTYRVFSPNMLRKQVCEKMYHPFIQIHQELFQCLGYPRLDLLDICTFNNKSNREKYRITWFPRWTSEKDNLDRKIGNFKKYYKDFLKFAYDNKEYLITIRPHPKMFNHYIESNILTNEEVSEFKIECNKNNIVIDQSEDYIDTIKQTDILVSDYTSLLIEVIALNKPIIYCDTEEGLNEEGKLIYNSSYHATEFCEIKKLIGDISKNDYLYDKRIMALNKIMPQNIGHIGKDIISYLKKDLLKNDKKNYYEIWKNDNSVILIGSYNLRKQMELTSVVYKGLLDRYMYSSIASMFSEQGKKIDVGTKNQYWKDWIEKDIEKKLKNKITRKLDCYILIDFLEERFDLIEKNNVIITKSNILEQESMIPEEFVIKNGSSKYMKVWKEAIQKMTKMLVSYCNLSKVILIKNFFAETKMDNGKLIECENIEEVHKKNKILNEMYNYFEKQCQNIKKIEISKELIYTDSNQYFYLNNKCFNYVAELLDNIMQ